MPQIIFKGVREEHVADMSQLLVDALSKATESPRDYFTLECPTTRYIFDGKIHPMYPLVEVKWFDRGETMKKHTARIIGDFLKEKGYTGIEVFFTNLKPEDYFELG